MLTKQAKRKLEKLGGSEADYILQVGGENIDGRASAAGGHMVQDSLGTTKADNIAFGDGNRNAALMTAIGVIKRGNELFTDYGRTYWEDRAEKYGLVAAESARRAGGRAAAGEEY